MSKNKPLSSIAKSVIGSRIVLVLAIFGLLTIAILLSGPKPSYEEELNQDGPQATEQTGVRPLTPAEIERQRSTRNYPVTSGVIVASTTVLMIIILGTLWELKRQR